ncbi:hypothetical protein pdam_00023610 [Pocillopora damicornis]|uniref:DCD domain-containing protein n=1 Tax=Pocillopora damicornis TaxID=46731 RepID=A0A3M6T7B8_POCDA|nr:hypothetical protein pdam_00023610 [Pocillopora damicornis]
MRFFVIFVSTVTDNMNFHVDHFRDVSSSRFPLVVRYRVSHGSDPRKHSESCKSVCSNLCRLSPSPFCASSPQLISKRQGFERRRNLSFSNSKELSPFLDWSSA